MRQGCCQSNSGGRRVSSVQLYQSRQGPRAILRAEPARNGHGKAPGGAAGYEDVNFFDTREFTDQASRRRRVLAEAQIGAFAVRLVGQQRAVWNANGFIKITCKLFAAPGVVRKRAGMLGTDDEHRMRVEGEVLAVPQA